MNPAEDPPTEDYLDFELEIGTGSGRVYPVSVVRSAAGEARGMMQFPLDDLALENQLLTLQNALLRSGGKPRHILLPEEQSVQDFGLTLFNTLFAGAIGNCYAVSRREAELQGKGLRVKLRILSPEMVTIPWEFLYDPSCAEYICLSRNTPVVRYLELPQPPQPLPVALPLRILGMITTPMNLPPLDVQREQQRMEKALEPLHQRGLVQLTWLTGQTWRDVLQAMRGGPWHIFHFIGHGSFDPLSDEGLIAFTDEQGQADLFRATQLARLLSDHRSLRLVVLNACESAKSGRHDVFSSAAANLVRHSIPAVLAMQYTITDAAAIVFSRAFYEALADVVPIDAAVSEARKAVCFEVENTLEWGIPVLFMRSPDGVLFTVSQVFTPTPALRQPPEPLTFPQETPVPVVRQPPPQPPVKTPPITGIPLKEDELELKPRRASGRGSAAYTVMLHNWGNAPAQYALSGEDDEQKLAYAFRRNPVALEPGREVGVALQVSTQRHWFGREQRQLFQVHARPAGSSSSLTTAGEFVNKAIIPRWVLLVASMVLAAGLVLALLLPTPPPVPFRVIAIDMSVNPPSIEGTACGTQLTVTYTATFHVLPNGPGGAVQFTYTTDGGGTSKAGLVQIGPGQISKQFQFTATGTLVQNGSFPGTGQVTTTSPNASSSQTAIPAGSCMPVPRSTTITFDALPDGTPITGDRFLQGDEFLAKGIRLAGAAQGAYCAGAVAAIRPAGSYNIPFPFLTTATPGNINMCNGVPVAILFVNPVRKVTLTFAGASVTYTLEAYDSSGNLLGTAQQNAIFGGGTFEISFSSQTADISKITFGYQAALTVVKAVSYEL